MKVFCRLLSLLSVLSIFGVLPGYCDDLMDIKRACLQRGNFHQGIYWAAECLQEAFTADQFHFTMTSVAPGAGLFALGSGFGYLPRTNRFETMIGGSAAMVPIEGSSVAQLEMTFAFPTRSLSQLKPLPNSTQQKFGLRSLSRRPQDDPVDAKMSLTLRWRRIDAREQDFYGLGPDTLRSGLSSYGLILSETYAGINNPITSWSSLGLDFSFLQPRVTTSISQEPAIRSLYSAATTPGLTAFDDFVRYEPYLVFRIPPHRSFFTTLRAGYAFNHALGDPRFSFNLLSASSSTFVPLSLPSHNTPYNRKWWQNAVCPSLRSGTRCSMGDLILSGTVAAAYTGAGSQVPFFFDQTLGGSDINGNDTLRGFGTYRFRGPNDVLFQAEYHHNLWGPIGLLSFYDTGKVALLRSDLSFSHLRHDIGPGLYFHLGDHEIARFYIGFGSEISRPAAKFGSSF